MKAKSKHGRWVLRAAVEVRLDEVDGEGYEQAWVSNSKACAGRFRSAAKRRASSSQHSDYPGTWPGIPRDREGKFNARISGWWKKCR